MQVDTGTMYSSVAILEIYRSDLSSRSINKSIKVLQEPDKLKSTCLEFASFERETRKEEKINLEYRMENCLSLRNNAAVWKCIPPGSPSRSFRPFRARFIKGTNLRLDCDSEVELWGNWSWMTRTLERNFGVPLLMSVLLITFFFLLHRPNPVY